MSDGSVGDRSNGSMLLSISPRGQLCSGGTQDCHIRRLIITFVECSQCAEVCFTFMSPEIITVCKVGTIIMSYIYIYLSYMSRVWINIFPYIHSLGMTELEFETMRVRF